LERIAGKGSTGIKLKFIKRKSNFFIEGYCYI